MREHFPYQGFQGKFKPHGAGATPRSDPLKQQKKNHSEITFVSSEITAVISEITPETPTYVVEKNKKMSIMMSI
jgi:hypothetical protein